VAYQSGSVVGTAGMSGCFRECVVLAVDDLCFPPDIDAVALSPA
jgi:hypothetical protein